VAGWFGYVIVFGELAVGVGLILGAFVGLAAAGGLLMNMAFLLAGTTNTNPVLVILGLLPILAWKKRRLYWPGLLARRRTGGFSNGRNLRTVGTFFSLADPLAVRSAPRYGSGANVRVPLD
jgi:hypothetical protein